MTPNEDEFTLGLGTLVLEAGRLEYILHGLMSHLRGQERAYGQRDSAKSASTHREEAEKTLRASDSQIPDEARKALLTDFQACDRVLKERNTYIHCCWTFDEETYQWRGVKANRDRKGALMYATCDDDSPGALAKEIKALGERLLDWDVQLFGENGDPDVGHPARVSVKRA